jgi:prepilin-type processing-associated H-X9-DG protein
MSNPSSRQLSLTGLICCGCLGVFALVAMLPAAERAQGVASRIRCASNLHQIGLAMTMYANNELRNGQSFPRTYYDLDTADQPKFFTNWKQPESFGKGAPEANDVTAAVYLLLKTQDLPPSALVCPESGKKALQFHHRTDDKGKDVSDPHPIAEKPASLSNFPGMDYVSYSFQNPYASKDALLTGWKWNIILGADFALAADLNPGGKAEAMVKPNSPRKELAAANSRNHGGAGQNVLYADGHVDFQFTPFCGPVLPDKTADNIYTRRSGSKGDPIIGPPMDHDDNVLLPTADYKPAKGK